MAPGKTKVTADTAAVNRLVDIISFLKTDISQMKEQLESCHNIIREQQKILTCQNTSIQTILMMITSRGSHSALHTSLNESGPKGFVFLGEDDEATVTPPSPPTAHLPSVPEPKPRRTRPRRGAANTGQQSSPRVPDEIASPCNKLQLPMIPQQQQEASASSTPASLCPGTAHSLPTAPRPSAAPRSLTVPCPASASSMAVPSTSAPSNVKQPQATGFKGLQAAGPRITSLHIFNLSEDTTSDDIIHHVQTQMGISSLVCEKLTVTRGKYSSFRLDIPADNRGGLSAASALGKNLIGAPLVLLTLVTTVGVTLRHV